MPIILCEASGIPLVAATPEHLPGRLSSLAGSQWVAGDGARDEGKLPFREYPLQCNRGLLSTPLFHKLKIRIRFC
ncbi:hypothetical protein CO2235_MP20207 [Cupriavidus oxalaticus]|uniref:Uncharacterized protein n=1 Tax=Cupriavidus oxalaticus TaxID=96344 RepID=A0A976BID8_9BURK|nr:hypothetical protein CO2235_MP20207 [Cupriavidus oxalaticus]